MKERFACDKILRNASIIDALGEQHSHYALVIEKGKIAWCGKEIELPSEYCELASDIEDCNGRLLTPGLIDCHTHLVYAGNRAEEYKLRLQGMSYEEISRRGGGIQSTVSQTRKASEEELYTQSFPRILSLKKQGVSTVEIKSGYGLNLDTELKMLRVARKLGKESGLRVKTTFLGAHATPAEYQGRTQEYVNKICYEMIPAVAESGLADAVDIFCESIGFSLKQTEQVFQAAISYGLPIKCHAEQLSSLGGAALAANYGALSADHLEYLTLDDIDAMAQAGTVAVLLPGAFYFLNETQMPPIRALRDAGVGMAIATDCNPGSSPTTSLLLMMSMACRFFSLTVPEALAAVTFQAAKALGIHHEVGAIKKGMRADLIRWSFADSSMLSYEFGGDFPHETMIAGCWQDNLEHSCQ